MLISQTMESVILILCGCAATAACMVLLWRRELSRLRGEMDHRLTLLAKRQRAMESTWSKWEVAPRLELESSERVEASRSEQGARGERIRRMDGPTEAPQPLLIAIPQLSTPDSTEEAAAAMAELSRRFSAIWSLANQGCPPDEVSRRTGSPIGEVELILGLKRRGQSRNQPPD